MTPSKDGGINLSGLFHKPASFSRPDADRPECSCVRAGPLGLKLYPVAFLRCLLKAACRWCARETWSGTLDSNQRSPPSEGGENNQTSLVPDRNSPGKGREGVRPPCGFALTSLPKQPKLWGQHTIVYVPPSLRSLPRTPLRNAHSLCLCGPARTAPSSGHRVLSLHTTRDHPSASQCCMLGLNFGLVNNAG